MKKGRFNIFLKLFLVVFWFQFCLIGCQMAENKGASNKDNKAWELKNFIKVDSLNPIMTKSPELKFDCPLNRKSIQWAGRNVLNPAAVVKDENIYLLFRAQDASGTSRIGIATSKDGLRFKKLSEPVLFPKADSMMKYEWNYKKDIENPIIDNTFIEDCSNCYFDGVEDPRVVQDENGNFIMTYTAYDGKTARLAVATSKDLLNWEKKGLAFKDEKYKDLWSKAGAIVTEKKGTSFVAKKIDGKYWMYFGDTDIFIANSDNLFDWQISEDDESHRKISVLNPRKGYFDSRLVESGPFAIYNDEGILLIYNSSNAQNFNDPSLPRFTYAAAQALFDKEKPYKLIDRTNNHFIHPNKDYEKVGEVNEVCFVEGLIHHNDSWFLYYGTADSNIAVAVSKNN